MVASLESYEQIEESVIRERAETSKDASLLRLLKIADQWREAECTPVFIAVQYEPLIIAVVSEETFGQPNLIN